MEEALTIANELEIEHPKNPKNSKNIVMTTDFLITKEAQGKTINIARTIKTQGYAAIVLSIVSRYCAFFQAGEF